MLYRPSTDKLIWWSQDLMMHQHDIDIVSDHEISVYNNNRTTGPRSDLVLGHNELLMFDFDSDTVNSPWADQFRVFDIKTISQGLADISRDGSIFVEDTNYGRLIKFSSSGEKMWEYVNKNDEGVVFTMNWSRHIDGDIGERIANRLQEEDCGE